jgi:biotin operon repressor
MAEEHYEKQFRGCWCPAEILTLIESGDISCQESILLLLIDSLVNATGEDCYASNAYFAKKLDISKTRITRMISKLKKMGLIVQTQFTGRKRYLKTTWSRLDIDSKDSQLSTTRSQTTRSQTTRQTSRKRLGSLVENDYSNTRLDKDYTIQQTIAEGACRPSCDKTASPDDLRNHPRWRRYAEQFAQAISKTRQLNKTSKISQWANSFYKIHKLDGVPIKRLRSVLKWYCRQWELGDLIRENSDYIPVASSGRAFRKKFDAIEIAMNKQQYKRHNNREPMQETGPRIKVNRIGKKKGEEHYV